MIRTFCIVCGDTEDGDAESQLVETVCADLLCQTLTTEPITKHMVRQLFDKAARRAVYVSALTEEDSEKESQLCIMRYQRARRRAVYAMGHCDE